MRSRPTATMRFEGGLLQLDHKDRLASAHAEGTWPDTATIALRPLWECVAVAASDGTETLDLQSATDGVVAEFCGPTRSEPTKVSIPYKWL
jgi:hypothetical protein